MSEQRNYMAEVQALIDQKWKENPEEMKRVMAEIKAKEKKEKKKPKVETPKRVSFDHQLTQELIKEMSQSIDYIDMSKIQALLEKGADVNAKRNDGWTPLHWASCENHIEIAELLLKAGAYLNAETNDGETPFDLAEWDEMEELLQKYEK